MQSWTCRGGSVVEICSERDSEERKRLSGERWGGGGGGGEREEWV